MRGIFESEGDIRTVDLLSALVAFWREKADGALRFSRPGVTAGFDISGGELVATLSSQAQFDTAAILIRAGKLDPAAVGRLTFPEGGDAAVAAMQAGLITAREWKWGQKIRAIEVLSDLLGWLEGEYVREARSVSSPPGDWTLPLPRLVLELFLRSRDRTLVELALGATDLPLLRAADFEEEFETFGLTADAGDVVGLIDGRASAEEVAEKSNADEFAVLKLLAALTTLGLVHPAEAAPAAALRRPAVPGRESRPAPAKVREEARPEIESEVEAEDRAQEAEGEAPETPVRESETEIETEAAPLPVQNEPMPPAAPARMLVGETVTPATPPVSAEPVAAERLPPRAEPSVLPEQATEAFDPVVDLTGGGETPPDPPRRGSAAVLLGLLSALIIAVTALVIVRSRGAGREPGPVSVQPTAAENPVFPPAETALPLPGHGKSSGRIPTRTTAVSPAATGTPGPLAGAPPSTRVPAAVPPTTTSAPTRPAPTKPPTAVPTRPAPTRPPTAVPTRPAPTRPPTAVPTRPAPTKPPTAVPTRLVPTRPPTAVPTRPAPTRPPTAVPTRPAPTKPPTAVATRPLPTRPPTRVPTRAAPPTPLPAPVPAARGELTREDWIRRAERDRNALARRSGVRYSVQLELACELETLQKAWDWDKPSGTIWLLTTPYRGRTCFRVLWGRYGSLAEAREARSRVPAFFTTSGNRPTVVSVR